jgi:hypothetical protein
MRVEWPFFMGLHRSNVGVSLLAIAVYQSLPVWLTNCYREQAHSYREFAFSL